MAGLCERQIYYPFRLGLMIKSQQDTEPGLSVTSPFSSHAVQTALILQSTLKFQYFLVTIKLVILLLADTHIFRKTD